MQVTVNVPEKLLASGADLGVLHRRVVRVGAAAAWVVATLHLAGGILTGETTLFLEAAGAATAASLMSVQVVLKKENAVVALLGSAAVLIAMYATVVTPSSLVAAAFSLVVIASVGSVFIATHQLAASGVIGVALLATPVLWELDLDDALPLGFTMALAFLLTATVLVTIRNAALAMADRYRAVFERSPTAVNEEDWSEALEYIRSEYSGRPDRILAFLLAYPQVVRRAVSRTRVVRVNAAAIKLFDASSGDQLLGYRNGDTLTEEELEPFANAMATIYAGKQTFSQDVRTRTLKGRPIWLQVNGSDTLSVQPYTSILVGLGDITHLRARQDEMVDMVRAKDDFIARVSHELRTPLTAVLGLASEMNGSGSMSDEERAELIALVAGQAEEMSFIVEDLLVASRAEIGTLTVDPRPIDLEAELHAAVEGLGILVPDLPASVPPAFADPVRVRQILRNLLTNARRYGGSTIRVLAGSHYDKVWVEVRDDGDGVPESLARVIFEPYGTAHQGVDGAVGLGLSVSRQLAELMGGSLGYRRDGDESAFRLQLPLSGEKSGAGLASQMADA
jgi:signal transduction histidine kinase